MYIKMNILRMSILTKSIKTQVQSFKIFFLETVLLTC